ncbi:uncharacterized protein RSE6_00036 [Rhynchosporium secalis]|uniref:Mid2 domain-containing protein n=1 Tax=Rhynchosporium secalis TaxID=38038 RepID=A0A1E1LU86_RHYSE|nr:uncharacterized protein RSE6_00036 [Rhynchosporium secalis]
MRLSQTPSSLVSLVVAVLSQTDLVNAGPYPKDEIHDLGFAFLKPRQCVMYCGSENQFCCTQGQGCFTTANIAGCTATAGLAGGDGGYGVYTTTWTETNLVTKTSTISYGVPTTPVAVAPMPTANNVPAICTTSLGQSSCDTICCAADQRCAAPNSCTAHSEFYQGPSTYAAPIRPTSGGISTATTIVSATTTVPFQAPATASGSLFPIAEASGGGGLSAGAIAGIVIGVIAAIIILLLLCFCCIAKAGFDGLLAIFGLGKKKRRSTERIEVTEERYSRHGSHAGGASRRDTHSGWFGGSKPARVNEKRKKESGFGGLGMVGAGLLGLAAVLGLKRNHDKKEKSHSGRSDISSSYYTDSMTGTSATQVQTAEREKAGEPAPQGGRPALFG